MKFSLIAVAGFLLSGCVSSRRFETNNQEYLEVFKANTEFAKQATNKIVDLDHRVQELEHIAHQVYQPIIFTTGTVKDCDCEKQESWQERLFREQEERNDEIILTPIPIPKEPFKTRITTE